MPKKVEIPQKTTWLVLNLRLVTMVDYKNIWNLEVSLGRENIVSNNSCGITNKPIN
jgi:hypothetical protein